MNLFKVFSLIILSSLLGGCALHSRSGRDVRTVGWQPLTEVSSENGNFSKGISACFSGHHNGCLIIAGGCNFPGIPAAESGKKVFYDDVYMARMQNDTVQKWERAGALLSPSAYGVSVSHAQGVVCVGGVTADGPTNAVYRLECNGETGKVSVHSLPSLPYTIDNMAGALIGDTLYIVGGNVDKKPSSRMFALKLGDAAAQWRELSPVPGKPRTQPVCTALRKEGKMCLFIAGGFAAAVGKEDASLCTDAYCYEPETNRWTKIAEPCDADGQPISQGGGVALSLGDSLMLCMGGVNKDIFLDALKREQALKKAIAENDLKTVDELRTKGKMYMNHPSGWYKLNKELLIYSPNKNKWTTLGSCEHTARAGASAVSLESAFYLFFGETKPGIRTPEIWKGKYPETFR